MKKLLTITFALCSALMAMACSSNDPEESNMPENTEQNGEGKMLVIYFSRAGENWQVGYVERGNTADSVVFISRTAKSISNEKSNHIHRPAPDGLPERAVSESRDSQERRYDR